MEISEKKKKKKKNHQNKHVQVKPKNAEPNAEQNPTNKKNQIASRSHGGGGGGRRSIIIKSNQDAKKSNIKYKRSIQQA
jgi:hypothetical protein